MNNKASIAFSAFVGVFYAVRDRKKATTDNYVFGDKRLSTIAVSISMGVSVVSAMTIIAFPTEVYFYGTPYFWIPIASFFASIFSAVYFVPLYYNLQLRTVYEFLEKRYNKFIRTFCSILMSLQMIMYMGAVVYLPALALNAVTPISLNLSIVLTSLICTFYTTLGGMKAVVWTDVFQSLIMFLGSIIVCIKTVVVVGGFGEVLEATQRGGRNNFVNGSLDPRIRSSTIALIVATIFTSCNDFACNQMFAQRYISCRNVKSAQTATILRIVPVAIYMWLALLSGLAMYAYYEDCDPMTYGIIKKPDQIMPLLVVEIFEVIPGMAGLYVSAAYSGTLSSVSSGINSIANVVVFDYIEPFKPTLKQNTKLLLCKIISLLTGLIVMALALVTSLIDATVIEITFIIQGAISGPIFAVYTMGAFIPLVTSLGSLIGLITGIASCLWISIGAAIYGSKEEFKEHLPLTIEGCKVSFNATTTMDQTTQIMSGNQTESLRPLIADTLYSISPFLLILVGFMTTIIVGIATSYAFGKNIAASMDPDLFVPLLDNKSLPASVIRFFRFGVPEKQYKIPHSKTSTALL